MSKRTAEIAGAGLAGLALAVRLAQLGWQVTLHERNSELRMFGAGIWLWENGLRSLQVLGAYDAALARAKTIKEWPEDVVMYLGLQTNSHDVGELFQGQVDPLRAAVMPLAKAWAMFWRAAGMTAFAFASRKSGRWVRPALSIIQSPR